MYGAKLHAKAVKLKTEKFTEITVHIGYNVIGENSNFKRFKT